MKEAHLQLAKQLIELKHLREGIKVTSIDFEDGSGRTFIFSTTIDLNHKMFIRL
jgi:hypothetical protein